MSKLANRLDHRCPIILDGGLATQLEAMGQDISGELWSAALLESHPRAIVDAHRAYLDAGAEVIISAGYQASRGGFVERGHSEAEADRLIASAVHLALTARAEYLSESGVESRSVLVAASIGPFGAVLHDGSEYTGIYDASDDELRRFHAERLTVLDRAGADILAVETIPNAREARVLSKLLARCSTPAWVCFACRDGERLSDGTALQDVVTMFDDRVFAVGINCTPPQYTRSLIESVRSAAPGKRIIVYPNSGETFDAASNSWSGEACDFDRDFDVAGWYAAGASLIGGCCRTGPAHIAQIRERLVQAAGVE